ncbi:MAG TPA: alpha/beta fold hydrolase [Flavisolibacter sp.]|nr:alpha/beta fold hydrolase [Flavisolibacter sp.]
MSSRLRLIVLLFFVETSIIAQPVPRFEDAERSVIEIPESQKMRFGYLVVWEDRSKKERTIRLPVFILKSRGDRPKQDPVLFTSGGPGGSSLNTARFGQYYSFLNDRDFIIFEQRGTRYAQPSLGCPELDSIKRSNSWLQLTDKQREALQVQAAMLCKTRLMTDGADLSAYNTKASADDIEDLRKALGIQQLNLYTVSYSTKIAQVMLRDYPASIRSAVMDSPLPLWVNYDETSLCFFAEKMDLLFAACDQDSACRLAYPDLKKRFLQFLQKANRNPVLVELKSPVDSSVIKVSLTGSQIASFVDLGNTYSLRGLPKLMDRLCKTDYEVLKPFIYQLFTGDDRAMGMRLSVWCSEEFPFERMGSPASRCPVSAAYKGMKTEAVPLEVCRTWKLRPADEKENRTFTSAVPVLLINGEFDPDTPAAWGEEMSRQFSNSYHLVFKGMGHTPSQYWDDGCAMQSAQAFFDNPAQRPALKCFTPSKALEFNTGKQE